MEVASAYYNHGTLKYFTSLFVRDISPWRVLKDSLNDKVRGFDHEGEVLDG